MKRLLILILTLGVSQSANILGIFNYPSYSHQMVFQKIIKDLSTRGHHLTILTVNEINENYPNVTEIYLNGSYNDVNMNFAKFKEKKTGMLELFKVMFDTTVSRSWIQIQNPGVQSLINKSQNQTFDLILLEYMFQHPLIYFAEIYDCPIIVVAPMEVTNFVHLVMGNHVNYAVHPEYLFSYEHGKLSMVQRFVSLVSHSTMSLLMVLVVQVYDLIFKGYFPNVTRSFTEIEYDRIEFLLQNANPILGATRPVTHNTIMLGNLHIEPPKEFNEGLKSFLDASVNGVVYVSFGTNVNTNNLNDKSLMIFINTFKKLNYDILWKLDGNHEFVMNSSKNIHASKWYPQADLLAHPNVKLFITHCGLLSMEESIDREVPMIAIPFLLDQYNNAYKVRNEEIGIYVEYESLTEETLHNAIEEATKPKYIENIRKFKKIMYDFPVKSREKAVWWIEYALRNRGSNRLKYSHAKLPFHQKYYLDIALITVAVIFSIKIVVLTIKSAAVGKIKNE